MMENDFITKAEFEAFLPVAKTPANQTGIYDMVSSRFEQDYDTVINMYVGTYLSDSTRMPEELRYNVKRLVSIMSFIGMFRELDLVLTPTGFGIVNNNNVAPASKERVDALFISLWKQHDTAREALLICLTKQSSWSETLQANLSIDTLCWTKSLVEQFAGIADPDHDTFIKTLAQIRLIEARMADKISFELKEELLAAIRSNSLTSVQQSLLRYIYMFIGYELKENHSGAKGRLAQVINFLDGHLSDFPTYKNSQAYSLNNNRGYQNAQQDSTYFFK